MGCPFYLVGIRIIRELGVVRRKVIPACSSIDSLAETLDDKTAFLPSASNFVFAKGVRVVPVGSSNTYLLGCPIYFVGASWLLFGAMWSVVKRTK
jgi:hypothetical protein